MRLPASGAYTFAFQILDMLFSKEELGKSLVYETKKSDKPLLSPKLLAIAIFLIKSLITQAKCKGTPIDTVGLMIHKCTLHKVCTNICVCIYIAITYVYSYKL